MDIVFEKDYLSELYYKGKTSDKKHRFPSHVIAKYCKTVDILESVKSIEDLYRYHSLNYKSLSGDKSGLESVRVNDKYRIEFKTSKLIADTIVTVCNIVELSNHYK